jgi:hypothetical protein
VENCDFLHKTIILSIIRLLIFKVPLSGLTGAAPAAGTIKLNPRIKAVMI